MAETETETLRVALTVGQAAFEAEGEPGVVRELYEEFKGEVWPGLQSAAVTPRRRVVDEDPTDLPPEVMNDREPPGSPSGESTVVQRARALPLGGFVKVVNPSTNAERAALLAAWLTNHEEMDTVTVSQVEAAWDKTRWTTPGNVSRDMSTAATDGLLKKEGRAEYSVTDYGEGELDKLQAE